MKHTRTSINGGPSDGAAISIPSGVTSFTISDGPLAGDYDVTVEGATLRGGAEPQVQGKQVTKRKATSTAPRTADTSPPTE